MPLAALAALGGAYPSSTLPLLMAAAAAFVIARPTTILAPGVRLLDGALIAFLAGILAQCLRWPAPAIEAIAPAAVRVQSVLALDAAPGWRTLTIDEGMTRAALASALATVLVFWAARDALTGGGRRAVGHLIAAAAGLAAAVGVVQRATAPELLLWTWTPIDPGAQPFGPFVNRNHFASWLLMATALTSGHLTAHVRMYGLLAGRTLRQRVHALAADGSALGLALSAALATLAMLSAGSRGATLGALAAAAVGLVLARRRLPAGRALLTGGAAVALLLAAGLWANLDVLAPRLIPGPNVSRATIWRETLPILRDFPLTGTGLGTYAQSMLVYQQSRDELLFNQAHSESLQLLAEGGALLVIPALIAAAAWLRLARQRLAGAHGQQVWLRIGAAAGVAGVVVQGLWESSLRIPANAMLFALLAAIVVHAPARVRLEERADDYAADQR